jgi:uncharacterized membrane protein YhdT
MNQVQCDTLLADSQWFGVCCILCSLVFLALAWKRGKR